MFTAKRSTGFNFADGAIVDVPLIRGGLDFGLMITVPYQDLITGAATAARIVATPIRNIQIIGENGKVLHSISGVDAINKARIYEQTPLSELSAPPTTLAPGTYTGLANIPIMFKQPFADGNDTVLPTYDYANLICRITCGSHTDVYRGGVGTLSATNGTCFVTQLEMADIPFLNNRAIATQIARTNRISVDRPLLLPAPGVVSVKTKQEIGTTSDLRAIMVTMEDANGDQTNALASAINLREDNTTDVYSQVPIAAIRADNAKIFGVPMPTGVFVLEFAENKNIAPSELYKATQKQKLDLLIDFLAVNGNVRFNLITIEPAKAA